MKNAFHIFRLFSIVLLLFGLNPFSTVHAEEGGGTILADAFLLPESLQEQIAAAASMTMMDAPEGSPPASTSPGYYDTSVFMTGSVAVGIILPESSGDTENWTTAEMDTVIAEIQAGMEWWRTKGGTTAGLDFQYDIQRGVPTAYEPITMSTSDEETWIRDVMDNLGYSHETYDSHYEQVYAYVNSIRSTYEADWAFNIFVVRDRSTSTHAFTDGYFAYAYLGGPFQVMTYGNDGWGIGNMNWIAAHETGHIFGAGDQYYQAGYGGCTSKTQRYGYLGVENSNCDYGWPTGIISIMKRNSDAVDVTAAGQIGWRDTNANGTPDVNEPDPVLVLEAHTPNPTDETALTYSGYAYVPAYPHAVCSWADDRCYDIDVTNQDVRVEYAVDGGGWLAGTATDGAFDTDVEAFTFTAGVSPGVRTMHVRAAGAFTNLSAPWTDTVTINALPDLVPPGAVGALSAASGPTAGSLVLSWLAPENDAGDADSGAVLAYLVRYAGTEIASEADWEAATPVTVGLPVPGAPGSPQNMTISGLEAGTTYTAAVRGQDGTPSLGPIVSASAATIPAPGAFAKVSPGHAATGRATTLTLYWGASVGAGSYEYCIDTNVDTVCDTGWVNVGTNRSVTVSGLAGSTTYYWQVRGVNGGGTTEANAGTWWNFTTTYCYTLTTGVLPGGSGAVNTDKLPNCAGGKYSRGTTVTLTAVPNAGYAFNSWSGSVTGSSNPAAVSMLANKSVTANFVAILPGAFAKVSPVNAATGRATSLTLYWGASAGAGGYEYCIDTVNDSACDTGWVNVGTNRSVTVSGLAGSTTYYWQVRGVNGGGTTEANAGTWWNFTTTYCYTLTTGVNPGGSGTVSADKLPNCAGGKYSRGTTVTLTAVPNSGYAFSAWSGSVTGVSNPIAVSMLGNRSVTANFTSLP